jgi:hypothetical protein
MYIILLINLINCKKKFEDTKRVVSTRRCGKYTPNPLESLLSIY